MKNGSKTFWLSLITVAAATVLAAMKIIDGQAWSIAVAVATGAKGLQGAADRFKPRNS